MVFLTQNYILAGSKMKPWNKAVTKGFLMFKLYCVFFYNNPWLDLFYFSVGLMAQTASVYLTVLVTVERFIVVCHPLKARSLCTTTRTRLGVLIVMSFSVLYNFSRFFEYTYHTSEIIEEVRNVHFDSCMQFM